MAVPDKQHRVYPYNNGLLLGVEADIVLTDENCQPIDASRFFEEGKKYESNRHGGGVNDDNGDEGKNYFKAINGMIRMFTKLSYCRGYATDNVWWTMKELLVHLKKRAHISFVPYFLAEDFDKPRNDGMSYIAAGHLRAYVRKSIYDTSISSKLFQMTFDEKHESHKRLKDAIRLLVGIISTLMDRRESAVYRRQDYGPGEASEFRITDKNLVYQTPTNFWLFHPALCHLILGAWRMAYFIAYNGLEPEIYEGFEARDVSRAIKKSDYETLEEIWMIVKHKLNEPGYPNDANPFWQHRKIALDFLMDNGPHMMHGGVYKNWQLAHKRDNFQGHFAQLPSWEAGVQNKVLVAANPHFKKFVEFRDSYVKRQAERASF